MYYAIAYTRMKNPQAIGHVATFKLLQENRIWADQPDIGIGRGFWKETRPMLQLINDPDNKMPLVYFSNINDMRDYLSIYMPEMVKHMVDHAVQLNKNFGIQIASTEQIEAFRKSTKPVQMMTTEEIDSMFTERFDYAPYYAAYEASKTVPATPAVEKKSSHKKHHHHHH